MESIYGKYATLTENLRNSDYLISLPPLPVSCVELDGDARFVYIHFNIAHIILLFVYNMLLIICLYLSAQCQLSMKMFIRMMNLQIWNLQREGIVLVSNFLIKTWNLKRKFRENAQILNFVLLSRLFH